MVDVITYEVLYDLLREEKQNPTLVKLEKDFYEKVARYLSEKRAILEAQEKKASVFTASETAKTKKQLESVQRVIQELYERRENKAIDLALFQSRTNELVDTSLLLELEKEFYYAILESLNAFRKDILHALLEARVPKITQEKASKPGAAPPKELKTVRFVQAVPKFVGTDLNVYGPYEEDDIASLPGAVAEVLAKKEKVKPL